MQRDCLQKFIGVVELNKSIKFTKMNKKVLIVSIVFLAVLLIAGFFFYKYLNQLPESVENSNEGASTENLSGDQNDNVPQFQIEEGGIGVQAENGGGSLTVCLDKCGDTICQETDMECEGEGNLNCVCPETPEECPQDCN